MQGSLFKELFLPENKRLRSHVLLALLIGVLFLATGKGLFGREEKMPASEEESKPIAAQDRETERRMAEILSKVQGAGAVDVMLTYCKTQERTIAQDEMREETDSGEKTSLRIEQKAVLTEERGGKATPFILSEQAPVVEGVVIVAEGGAEPNVQAALHRAAEALLHVPAHKIAVLQMK